MEGLDHIDASKSDAHGVSTREALVSRLARLEQATACFARANDAELESKVKMHQELLSRCLDASKALEPKAVSAFAGALVQCLKQGLADEAAQALHTFIFLWRQHEADS